MGFHTEFCEFANCEFLRILKIIHFHRVKELSKSNQTRHWVSPVKWKCEAKSIFGLACLGKRLVFQTELYEFREKGILKIGLFHRVKELPKSNQTRYWVSSTYWQCKAKSIFCLACLGKKLYFHIETFEFREKGILKTGLFHRLKELPKSNQTRYWVSPAYWQFKAKIIFCLACLGKKLDFPIELFEFREEGILKTGLFHRVKELSNSNPRRYGVSPV